MSIRVVKAELNGDKRRVACDSTSFATLLQKLGEAYGVAPAGITVKYLDDEDDMISIVNDADLAMAWELGGGNPLLKLALDVAGAAATPAAATPSPAAPQSAGAPAGAAPDLPDLLSGLLSGLMAGGAGPGGPGEVPAAFKKLMEGLPAKLEQLPAKLEQMSRQMAEVVEGMAEQAADQARPHVAPFAPHVERAGQQASDAASAAAQKASETATAASAAATVASERAQVAAAQAIQEASAAASMAADFLPPEYRLAVNTAMAAASAEIAAGSEFLPPAYREAVNRALGQNQPADAAEPEPAALPTAEECHAALAAKFGEDVSTSSLTIEELRAVTESAETASQLHVIEAAMKARCHLGIWCDKTGAKPIRGTRYSRAAGADTYDLCEAAWKSLDEGERATFRAIERPELAMLLRTSRAVIDTEPAAAEPAAEPVAAAAAAAEEAVPEPACSKPVELAVASAGGMVGRADEAAGVFAERRAAAEAAAVVVVQDELADAAAELLVSVSSDESFADVSAAEVVEGTPVTLAAAAPYVPHAENDAGMAAYMSSLLPAPVEHHDVFPVDTPPPAAASSPLGAVPEAYQEQVARLLEMGYEDVDRLAALVAHHEGDIRATIMAILEQ